MRHATFICASAIILFLLNAVVYGGEFMMFGNKLEREVAAYKGDGEITFSKRKFFQAEGVRIKFNEFNLNEDFKETYQLSALPKLKHDYIIGIEVIAPSRLENMLEGHLKISINTQDGTINQSFAGELNDRNNWIWSFSTMGTTQFIEYFIYSKRALDRTAGRIPKDVIARLSSADEIVVSIEYKGKQAPANLKGRLMVKAGGYK